MFSILNTKLYFEWKMTMKKVAASLLFHSAKCHGVCSSLIVHSGVYVCAHLCVFVCDRPYLSISFYSRPARPESGLTCYQSMRKALVPAIDWHIDPWYTHNVDCGISAMGIPPELVSYGGGHKERVLEIEFPRMVIFLYLRYENITQIKLTFLFQSIKISEETSSFWSINYGRLHLSELFVTGFVNV